MRSSAVDVAAVQLKIAAVLNRDSASLKLQAQISGIREGMFILTIVINRSYVGVVQLL